MRCSWRPGTSKKTCNRSGKDTDDLQCEMDRLVWNLTNLMRRRTRQSLELVLEELNDASERADTLFPHGKVGTSNYQSAGPLCRNARRSVQRERQASAVFHINAPGKTYKKGQIKTIHMLSGRHLFDCVCTKIIFFLRSGPETVPVYLATLRDATKEVQSLM